MNTSAINARPLDGSAASAAALHTVFTSAGAAGFRSTGARPAGEPDARTTTGAAGFKSTGRGV